MSDSRHSPTDLQDTSGSRTTGARNLIRKGATVTRVRPRPVRADGFGNRFPVLFDHRDDIPARELAHWGPGARYMLETFIAVVILLAVAAIAIIWYLA